MTVILPKINLEIRTFVASQALGASELAPWRPQVYMNLNTLSTQTPRRQELLGHIKKEWQIEMMAMFDPEKGCKFHAQPQTGAYYCFTCTASVNMLYSLYYVSINLTRTLFGSCLGPMSTD